MSINKTRKNLSNWTDFFLVGVKGHRLKPPPFARSGKSKLFQNFAALAKPPTCVFAKANPRR